jgi:hypothetical protein
MKIGKYDNYLVLSRILIENNNKKIYMTRFISFFIDLIIIIITHKY